MTSDAARADSDETERTLGLRSNLGQFSLLVLNAFVGGMVGIAVREPAEGGSPIPAFDPKQTLASRLRGRNL